MFGFISIGSSWLGLMEWEISHALTSAATGRVVRQLPVRVGTESDPPKLPSVFKGIDETLENTRNFLPDRKNDEISRQEGEDDEHEIAKTRPGPLRFVFGHQVLL